ncbi:MAG: hypothetical protein L6R35_007297 [Caloplaca aegaea]|nr:MAG: hypothetical protein L6R35_007297 [Caloplaca aegaea]
MTTPLLRFFKLCYASSAFLSYFSFASALPQNVWHVSIWKAPAPARESGPPISANSLRDPAYRPAQIGGIFAAYIFSLLVIGTGLLLVGRRLRRAAQTSPRTLAMEIINPTQPDVSKASDPSPISPTSTARSPYAHPLGPSPCSTLDMKSNWPSPEKTRPSMRWPSVKRHQQQPSMQSSVVTFDESVIEEDKIKNQYELERLYTAVLEHDELKSTGSLPLNEAPLSQNPPELQHLRAKDLPPRQFSPPPRGDAKSPARTLTKSPKKSVGPSPIMVHSRNSSRSSFGSFSKKRGLRNLPISPPMGSPDLVPENLGRYAETEPLSPRFYNPGPPPPKPPAREAQPQRYQQEQLDASRLSPTQGSFREALGTPRTSIPTFQTVPEQTELTQPPANDPAIQQPTPSKTKRAPAPLSLKTQTSAGMTGALPLRSAPLPLRNLNTSRANRDRPPSLIKATVLERKAPDHRLGTPRTGVPSTPYSPYMPFTPLTPMTPSRLVTREERKKRERGEGRRVATLDDKVVEESEIWGDAY